MTEGKWDYNLPLPHGFKKNPSRTFLTEDQVDHIRTSSERVKDLAIKYGVHHTTVSNIRNGRSHKIL